MRYTYQDGVKQSKKATPKPLLWLLGLGFVAGIYVVSLLAWPALPISSAEVQSVTDMVKHNQPDPSHNRLYVPKLGLIVPIGSGENSLTVVKDSGNPIDGGNYILSGNKLALGPTPGATAERSPLYHVERLAAGDDIFIDYQGKRYDYKVDGQQTVASNDSSFETPTTKPTLTLYTRSDGVLERTRQVIFAHPIGVVTWIDGKAGLKAL
ncbi:MAG TPA: sortase [Candidatus Saccharimonadales bacterium]|nr:sortase [Candidatus Saccharimonadales bacterium]